MTLSLYNQINEINDLIRAAHPHGGTTVIDVPSPSGGEGRVEDAIEHQVRVLHMIYTEPTARILADLATNIEKGGDRKIANAIDRINELFVKTAVGPTEEGMSMEVEQPAAPEPTNEVFSEEQRIKFEKIRDSAIERVLKGSSRSTAATGAGGSGFTPPIKRIESMNTLRGFTIGQYNGKPAPKIMNQEDFKNILSKVIVGKSDTGDQYSKDERGVAMRYLTEFWGKDDPTVKKLLSGAGYDLKNSADQGERERKSNIKPDMIAKEWKNTINRIVERVDNFNKSMTSEEVDPDLRERFSKELPNWNNFKKQLLQANYDQRAFKIQDKPVGSRGVWIFKRPLVDTDPYYAIVKNISEREGSTYAPEAKVVFSLLNDLNSLGKVYSGKGKKAEEVTPRQMMARINKTNQRLGDKPVSIPAPEEGYEETASEQKELAEAPQDRALNQEMRWKRLLRLLPQLLLMKVRILKKAWKRSTFIT
jgi:hypothetical protein